MSLLLEFVVVLAQLYIIIWIIGFFLGLFNAGWRSPFYPMGPSLPGSIGSLILAIAIVIVFGHYSPLRFN